MLHEETTLYFWRETIVRNNFCKVVSLVLMEKKLDVKLKM